MSDLLITQQGISDFPPRRAEYTVSARELPRHSRSNFPMQTVLRNYEFVALFVKDRHLDVC
jgi:hypothetical protein